MFKIYILYIRSDGYFYTRMYNSVQYLTVFPCYDLCLAISFSTSSNRGGALERNIRRMTLKPTSKFILHV